jgi:hypothetical protein
MTLSLQYKLKQRVMFTKSEIIEMIFRPAMLNDEDMSMMVESMLKWSDEKLISNLIKVTGAKVYKLGSMFQLV